MFECSVCHKTSDQCQVQFCTKAGMYLCSKHKNQFLRHGHFLPDEKPVRTCEICGATSNETTVHWCKKANKVLCLKHINQINRLGHFLERTKRDRNEYVLHEDYAEIVCYDYDGNVKGTALIDLDDVEKCKPYKWMVTEFMGNSQYVKALIDGVNTGLHRFVMNYHGTNPVDHINRNGLDNRKCNLRIVTSSENSTNSKTRSATGEKNIYFKQGKYQVQIIRKYKTIFIQTFNTLEEAIQIRDKVIEEYNTAHNRVV